MATVYAVGGAKIYIGGVITTGAADLTSASFTSQTWVEIDGWITMGGIGDSSEVIRTLLINRNRVVKQKGPKDAGSMQNTFADLPSDAGQIAMRAADKTQSEYAVKVVFDDAPPATAPDTSTGTTLLFAALINGVRRAGGAGNAARTIESTFEVNSNVVEVAAVLVEG